MSSSACRAEDVEAVARTYRAATQTTLQRDCVRDAIWILRPTHLYALRVQAGHRAIHDQYAIVVRIAGAELNKACLLGAITERASLATGAVAVLGLRLALRTNAVRANVGTAV